MVYKWLFVDHFCLLCGQLTDDRRDLCVPCETELPWLRGACQRCALPLPAEGLVCGRCLKRPPAFEQVIAPWRYATWSPSIPTPLRPAQRICDAPTSK